MSNKKGTTILLTVIGIATLLVALVGATFAYFTATVEQENDDNNVTITTATLGEVVFNHGDSIELGTTENPAYPGAIDSKTFSIKSQVGSTALVDYTVTLGVSENTFGKWDETTQTVKPGVTNVQYLVCATLSDESDSVLPENTIMCSDVLTEGEPNEKAVWQTIDSSVNSYTLATAKLGTDGAIDSWTLFVRLNEIGEQQNYDQAQKFTARLNVSTAGTGDSTGYTTDENGNIVEYTPAG